MLPTKKNHVAFMFLCDHYLGDTTGKPSFIGVFESITLRDVPGALARFFFVASVRNAKGTRIEIVLTQPDGTSNALISQELPDQARDQQHFQFAIEFANLAFTQFGAHKMSLKLDDGVVGSVNLEVVKGNPPNAPSES
jgi:hypothetical protein